MKEKACLTGYTGRRWHGDEFVQIQMENLDVIQGLFSQIGGCLISGCAATITGIITIADGIVAIKHADGWKVVRVTSFSFAIGATRYLVVNKTTNNKQYNDLSSHAFEYDYAASVSSTLPSGTENVDYLKVTSTGISRTFRDALGNRTVPVSFSNTISLGGGISVNSTFTYYKNTLNNTLLLIGNSTIVHADYLGASNEGIPALITNFSSLYRPVSQKANFTAYLDSGIPNASLTDGVNMVKCTIETGGNFYIWFKKSGDAAVPNYNVFYSTIIPLD